MNLEHLIDQFELVTKSGKGIKKLRQLIIDLGVRGELTRQLSNDESAEKLLDRIKKERKKLYDEGQIRKPRDLDNFKKEEMPYKLP